jgi:hypothetical protein
MIERSQSLRTRKLNHEFISIVNILDVLELEKLLYLAVPWQQMRHDVGLSGAVWVWDTARDVDFAPLVGMFTSEEVFVVLDLEELLEYSRLVRGSGSQRA